MITRELIESLHALGLPAVPLAWSNKAATVYPEHEGRPDLSTSLQWLKPGMTGIAVKLYPPWGMLDFDTKNSDDKGLYEKFIQQVNFIDDRILSKIYCEKTRSGGAHVYIKYPRLIRKIPLAKSEKKAEVISLYTGGLLSFTVPTPDYTPVHNGFEDVDFLDDDQFDILIEICRRFNKFQEAEPSTESISAVYPKELEAGLMEYDKMESFDFHNLLMSMGLIEVKIAAAERKKFPYTPYLRKGSNAPYSAKAFFGRVKKLLIFSGSMTDFPSWCDRLDENDHDWVLTPSKIMYHKLGRSWKKVAEELKIKETVFISPAVANSKFPIEIFPTAIQVNFREIAEQRNIPLDLICTAAFFSITALSGNMYETQLNGSIKNILYALMVAPSGVGKSPAYDVVCGEIIAAHETKMYEEYDQARKEYKTAKTSSKGTGVEVKAPPPLSPRMIKGGTQEGIMRHAKYAKAGFGIYYDEGERMMSGPGAYKQDNSSLPFWNELWYGKTYYDVRADEEREHFVPETSISVLCGMQTSRMGEYFTVRGIESGIAGRFLISACSSIELNTNVNHFRLDKRKACEDWKEIILTLFSQGRDYLGNKHVIKFTEAAEAAFNAISSKRMTASNVLRHTANKDDVSAIMMAYDSKLYAYQGRFLIPLALLENLRKPEITSETVKKSDKLYDYFRAQALSVFKMVSDVHQSGLTENQQSLYDALPDSFSLKTANEVAKTLSLSDRFFSMSFARTFERMSLIQKDGPGKYSKNK